MNCLLSRLIFCTFLTIAFNFTSAYGSEPTGFERSQLLFQISREGVLGFDSDSSKRIRRDSLAYYINTYAASVGINNLTQAEFEEIGRQILIDKFSYSATSGNTFFLRELNLIQSELYGRNVSIDSLLDSLGYMDQARNDPKLWLERLRELDPGIAKELVMNPQYNYPFLNMEANALVDKGLLDYVFKTFGGSTDLLIWLNNGKYNGILDRNIGYLPKILESLGQANLDADAYCRANLFLANVLDSPLFFIDEFRDDSVRAAKASMAAIQKLQTVPDKYKSYVCTTKTLFFTDSTPLSKMIEQAKDRFANAMNPPTRENRESRVYVKQKAAPGEIASEGCDYSYFYQQTKQLDFKLVNQGYVGGFRDSKLCTYTISSWPISKTHLHVRISVQNQKFIFSKTFVTDAKAIQTTLLGFKF